MNEFHPLGENPSARKHKHEPKVHPLIRNSFAFVPSAGMRLAPEVLLLELMRECCFQSHYSDPPKNHELRPSDSFRINEDPYTLEEQAVLHALRGRRRRSKNAGQMPFFAPAYPHLARRAWFAKNRERVVRNFLLAGPLTQFIWRKGLDSSTGKIEQSRLIEELSAALLGRRSDNSSGTADILAAVLPAIDPNTHPYEKWTKNQIRKATTPNSEGEGDSNLYANLLQFDPSHPQGDQLAERIFEDLISLCELEGQIPRMQWLKLLMTFLRLCMPCWLLAQMRITTTLHDLFIESVDQQAIPSLRDIEQRITRRNRGLFHPTLTPTRELYDHVEKYMKARVEISILLYCLDDAIGHTASTKEEAKRGLSLHRRTGQTTLLHDLLYTLRDNAKKIKQLPHVQGIANGLPIRSFLTRGGEFFSAWRNPLCNGQGKNIDEFLRVLYRHEEGDEEGGYLVNPIGRGTTRGFSIFPGQLFLKTITYLSGKRKQTSINNGGSGLLVLQDVEDHFLEYGVDFANAADARPRLMEELQALGLLRGSPDAGSSASVASPYRDL